MKLNDKAKEQLNKVVERFRTGDVSIIKAVSVIFLDGDAPARKWSLGNRLLAFAQCGTLDVRGFNQWKEHGRTPKKGSRSSYILGPKMVKKENKDGEEVRICVGFTPIAVFSVNDTEGEPLPYEPKEVLFPELHEVAAKIGVTVSYAPTVEGGAMGWYSPSDKHITLGTDNPKTFAHEIAHAIHDHLGTLHNYTLEQQEAIADVSAAVICDLYGWGDYTGKVWQYVKHYYGDDTEAALKGIMDTMSVIEQVVKVITG